MRRHSRMLKPQERMGQFRYKCVGTTTPILRYATRWIFRPSFFFGWSWLSWPEITHKSSATCVGIKIGLQEFVPWILWGIKYCTCDWVIQITSRHHRCSYLAAIKVILSACYSCTFNSCLHRFNCGTFVVLFNNVVKCIIQSPLSTNPCRFLTGSAVAMPHTLHGYDEFHRFSTLIST